MSKFKVGDKVKCVDGGFSISLETNTVYTVKEVYEKRGQNFLKFEEIERSWYSYRFEIFEPAVFKLGSFYHIPNTGLYLYKCCGFTSTGVPFFENPDGSPVAVGDDTRSKLVEYVKHIVAGSKVSCKASHSAIVTAIHGDHAWVHAVNGGNPSGWLQKLTDLKVL